MAKKNIAAEIQELVNAGEATIVADNKFVDANGNPAKVRSMESMNDPLEVGDEFTIPEDYQVLEVPINENKASCVLVEVKAADGSERCMRFFPNSLAKNITPIDDNGKRMPKVKTGGEVATWFAQQGTLDKAMEGLKGKTIVVTAKETYTYKDYSTKQNRNTGVYSYDWKA